MCCPAVVTHQFCRRSTVRQLLTGEKLRAMGSGLSPNGLPFSQEGVVSLALLDKIKLLDLQRRRITVEAGARIQPVSQASLLKRPPCLSQLSWAA